MDGAQLRQGSTDDATADETIWSDQVGSFPPYGGNASQRTAVLDAVRRAYEDYAVRVTDERPDTGPYTMIMLGPYGGVGGFATLDCGDYNQSNIGFVSHQGGDRYGSNSHAAVVAHEAGHTYGLDHISDSSKIMNPTVYADTRFADDCAPLNGGSCWEQHQQYCTSGQNSHLELLGLFGSSTPDTQPPVVTITSPADGAIVGTNFDVVASVSDASGQISRATLMMDGMELDRRTDQPWTWALTNVPDGMYEFQVIALDGAGNEGLSDTVEVEVVRGGESGTASGSDSGESGPGTSTGSDSGPDPDASGGDPSGGTQGGGSGASSDAATGTDGGSGDGSETGVPPWGSTGAAHDDRTDGCACTARRAPSGASCWLLVLFASARTRRHACRSLNRRPA